MRVHNEFVHSESEVEGSSARENLTLWTGILGSPIVWLVSLQVSYMLVPWSCSTGHHWVLYVASAVFLVTAAVPGWLAWKCWRAAGGKLRPDRESSHHGRRQFMGLLGLMMSTLFFLLILAQSIPNFLLDPCQQ